MENHNHGEVVGAAMFYYAAGFSAAPRSMTNWGGGWDKGGADDQPSGRGGAVDERSLQQFLQKRKTKASTCLQLGMPLA